MHASSRSPLCDCLDPGAEHTGRSELVACSLALQKLMFSLERLTEKSLQYRAVSTMRIQGYRREGERKQEISEVSFLQAKNLRKVIPGSGNTKLSCRVVKGPVVEGEG